MAMCLPSDSQVLRILQVYYWCEGTDEVLWEPPPGATPRTDAERDSAAIAAAEGGADGHRTSGDGSTPPADTAPDDQDAGATSTATDGSASAAELAAAYLSQVAADAEEAVASKRASSITPRAGALRAEQVSVAEVAEHLSSHLRDAAAAVFAGASKLVWLAVEAEVRARDLAALDAAHGPVHGHGRSAEQEAKPSADANPSAGAASATAADAPNTAGGCDAGEAGSHDALEPAEKKPLTWTAFQKYSAEQLLSILKEMPAALREAEVLAKASAAAADAASAKQQQLQPPASDIPASRAEPPLPNIAAGDTDTAIEDGELAQETPNEPRIPGSAAPPLPQEDSAPGADAPQTGSTAPAAAAANPPAQPSANAAMQAASGTAVPATTPEEQAAPPPPPPAADPPAAVATGFAAGRPARLDPSPGFPAGPVPPMPGWPPIGAFPPFMPPYPFPPHAAAWPLPPPMFYFPPPGAGFPGVPAAFPAPAVGIAVSAPQPASVPDPEEPPPPLPDEPIETPVPPPEPGVPSFLALVAAPVQCRTRFLCCSGGGHHTVSARENADAASPADTLGVSFCCSTMPLPAGTCRGSTSAGGGRGTPSGAAWRRPDRASRRGSCRRSRRSCRTGSSAAGVQGRAGPAGAAAVAARGRACIRSPVGSCRGELLAMQCCTTCSHHPSSSTLHLWPSEV